MNFDEIVVKESPGLCRCCLSEGCYKDLGTEYTWMNENEVYADMLLECFDISISQHTDGPNGSNRLICEVCITRLRDACNFKKQVLDSEKKFVDMLARGEFQPKVIMYQAAPLKTEQLMEEPAAEDVEYLEDMDYEDDLPLNQVGQLEASVSDLASTVKVKGKRGRPKKTTSPVKTEKKPKISKMDAKPQSSKAVAKDAALTLTATKRNRLMKRNATIIIENTTVVPFKWHRQHYLCFYCHKQYKQHSELKQHTKDHKSKVKSAVSYLRRDEKVKIDVKDASCKICAENLLNVEDITTHLKGHNKVFTEDIPLGVIPYKLSDDIFQCAVCSKQFQYFVKLNQHMNEHFGSFVCDVCGRCFLSQDRLRCHSLSHGAGFRCNICSETFDSLTLRNQHETKVHSVNKALKCLYCSETFQNYNQRKKHHSTVHNIQTQEFHCPVCGKTFTIASKMKIHLKEVHLREKNYSCSICDQKFFSKTHVQKHLIKHFGERIHTCEVCNKSYARKQTLKDHMKGHDAVKSNSMKLHAKARLSETEDG